MPNKVQKRPAAKAAAKPSAEAKPPPKKKLKAAAKPSAEHWRPDASWPAGSAGPEADEFAAQQRIISIVQQLQPDPKNLMVGRCELLDEETGETYWGKKKSQQQTWWRTLSAFLGDLKAGKIPTVQGYDSFADPGCSLGELLWVADKKKPEHRLQPENIWIPDETIYKEWNADMMQWPIESVSHIIWKRKEPRAQPKAKAAALANLPQVCPFDDEDGLLLSDTDESAVDEEDVVSAEAANNDPRPVLGTCVVCKHPVRGAMDGAEADEHHKWDYQPKNGEKRTYFRHNVCRKFENMKEKITSMALKKYKKESPELTAEAIKNHLASASPETKLQWFHEGGHLAESVACKLHNSFKESRTEVSEKRARQLGKCYDDEALRKKYAMDTDKPRKEEYDSVKKRAKTFRCSVAKTLFYVVPDYEFETQAVRRDEKRKERAAAQEGAAKAIKNKKKAAAGNRKKAVANSSDGPAELPKQFVERAEKFVKKRLQEAILDEYEKHLKVLGEHKPKIKVESDLVDAAAAAADHVLAEKDRINDLIEKKSVWDPNVKMKEFFDNAKAVADKAEDDINLLGEAIAVQIKRAEKRSSGATAS